MAYTPLSLHIAAPCSEDWQRMTPDGGHRRFCTSCQKQVTDFSGMTDREIVRTIRRSPGGICGRFRRDQLQRPLREYVPPSPKWKGLLAAGGMFVGAGAALFAHALPPLPGIEVVRSGLSNLGFTDTPQPTSSSGAFRGRLVDAAGNAVAEAEIIFQDTDYTVSSDREGRFSLFAEAGQRLLVYSLGHTERFYTVQQEDEGFSGAGVEWRLEPLEYPIEMMTTGLIGTTPSSRGRSDGRLPEGLRRGPG